MWSSSKSAGLPGRCSAAICRRFNADVYELGGRTFAVHRGTQIVRPMVACVTAGFSTPAGIGTGTGVDSTTGDVAAGAQPASRTATRIHQGRRITATARYADEHSA